MVADLAAPLLPEYLHAQAPIAVPDAETTIWLFTLEHPGPCHLARRDARAVSQVLLGHLLSTAAVDGTAPNEWTFERGHWGKPRISGPVPASATIGGGGEGDVRQARTTPHPCPRTSTASNCATPGTPPAHLQMSAPRLSD